MSRTLLTAFLLVSVSHAQWSTDPANNLIVGYGITPELASDGAGGCYITYIQQVGIYDRILLERLNRYGYKPWGTARQIAGVLPGQTAAQITEDGSGGVIVIYTDYEQISPKEPGTYRIRVQRIDSSGNFLWGPTGIRVTLSETDPGDNAVVSDGTGGCIVAWVDMDTISYENHLRINRINSAGVRVWGDSGKFVWNYGFQAPGRPTIVADGRGGCYVIFGVFRLQRFDPLGTTYWPSPIQVPTSGRIMRVDNAANVYLFGGKSLGTRNGQALFTINLQKVDTTGALLWDSLGIVLDTINANNFPTTWGLAHEEGFSRVCWPQRTGGLWDLRTQIVRFDGSTVFPFGGRAVSNVLSSKGLVGVLSSDSLSTVFVWGDSRSPSGAYTQRLDTSGQQLWDTTDVVVSYSGPSKAVTDGNGGFIAVVGGQNFAVRAQQVNKYGQLGQVITSVKGGNTAVPKMFELHQNYPNPFNSATTINYAVPTSSWINISVYNILGQKLVTLVNSRHLPGKYSAYFRADGFPSGVYYYRMFAGGEQDGVMYTRKLLIIK